MDLVLVIASMMYHLCLPILLLMAAAPFRVSSLVADGIAFDKDTTFRASTSITASLSRSSRYLLVVCFVAGR